MSGWKWWYVGIAALFLVTGIAGWIVVSRVPDAGLADVHSVDDLMNLSVTLEYAEGDPSAAEDYDMSGTIDDWETQPVIPVETYVSSYSNSRESYLAEIEDADIVLIVTATGELEINTATLGQHFTVEQVVAGSDTPAVGEECVVWIDYGLQVMDGAITWRQASNLMQPGEEYLIFLNENELNEISGSRYYNLASSKFPYIRLPYTPETALSDTVRTAVYSAWADYEYFSAYQEICDIRNEIKKEILTYYGLYDG